MTRPLVPGREEWFAAPNPHGDGTGLRFACTMCGNCCSGPPGYVFFTEDEGRAIAARLGLPLDDFIDNYTFKSREGRSLREKPAPDGKRDCIFLDRDTIPGRAICGIYEDRPLQCRTWPFWPSNLTSPAQWQRAARTCPGIDQGPVHPLVQIRVQRDKLKI